MKRQKSKIFERVSEALASEHHQKRKVSETQDSGRVLTFVKMHGSGNDFILIDNLSGSLSRLDFVSFAKKYCSRNFGIGADGVLVVSPSKKADASMRVINPDGSEAEMCGNGIRCFAKYLIDNGIAKSPVKIETLAGIKSVEKVGRNYRVDMGIPKVAAAMAVSRFSATPVGMGNPHAVIFVDDFDFDWKAAGAEIEKGRMFPNRTNVEFVKIISPGELEVKVWERGAGATMACGTGACASLAAAVACKKSGRRATLRLPGGSLEIELARDNRVYMTGPAETVFTGEAAI